MNNAYQWVVRAASDEWIPCTPQAHKALDELVLKVMRNRSVPVKFSDGWSDVMFRSSCYHNEHGDECYAITSNGLFYVEHPAFKDDADANLLHPTARMLWKRPATRPDQTPW